MKKFITVALLALAPVFCHADGAKIYTRKARLEDFTAKTTRVVLPEDILMQTALREEVSRRWYLSPFEFCTLQDYEKQKNSTKFYFLRPTADEGVNFLTITKGGAENDKEILKRGFDVISVPVSAGKAVSAHEAIYISAYIDILQRYMEQAISSESKAYAGLETANKAAAHGKTPIFDSAEADKIFAADTPGYVCCTAISSGKGSSDRRVCYIIAVTSDTHELCWFRKHKISTQAPSGFPPQDIKAIKALCGCK